MRAMQAMHLSTIPKWVKTRHSWATTSHRREDRAVENTETLGRDALIWLANQISISKDSYRRLLLLAGELPSLKSEHLPSFASTEASWYRIFDLLGWRYLTRGSSAILSVGERRRGMEVLQRCYKMPVIQNLVDPVEKKELTDGHSYEYWSRYCDSAEDDQWRINHECPNHLFLLLRDIPCPSEFSSHELDATSQLSQWRNQQAKDPQAWDEVLSNASSLPSDFFSSCVAIFGNYCSGKRWYLWDDERKLYLSLARKAVQEAVMRDDFPPLAIGPLIRAYEALLVGYSFLSQQSDEACLNSLAQYGRVLGKGSADDHATHESIILLLSRQIHSTPRVARAVTVRDIVVMLWLRPSNPVLRNWEHLKEEQKGVGIEKMTLDWIKDAESISHIVEILRHLATALGRNPTVGPLWRTTAPSQVNDPHFVEALQTFDRLMGTDCSGNDHYTLINLICQDFEQEPYPDFDDYFTPSRLGSLTLLRDPCLQILVGCARGPDFLSPVILPEAYGNARRRSLTRVAEYVYKKFCTIDLPPAVQLQASLWPMNPNQMDLYPDAMHDTVIFNFLRRMFKHPILCPGCLDGPGHLATHLLSTQYVIASQTFTLFGKIPLKGRIMCVALVILSSLFDGDTSSLVSYLPRAEESIRRTLEEDIKEILASQFHLLVMVWNTSRHHLLSSEYSGPSLVGVRNALQLSYDSRSTPILAPLSQKLVQLKDDFSLYRIGEFAEREAFIEEATKVGDLLLTILAVRSIFGRHNSHRIACARAVGDAQPALDWLAPYEG